MSTPLLSILIPTVTERRKQFDKLAAYLHWQKSISPERDNIEIISLKDNKEMSIGNKRNELYHMANGIYSWQIDDDDWVSHDAINLIMNKLHEGPDCVGFKELCIFDGKRVESSNFSMRYGGWADNEDGFDHVRTTFYKCPILTEVCQFVGVKDIRFGEDHDFANRLAPHLKTETYIDEFIYWYQHNSSPHNERYGIK